VAVERIRQVPVTAEMGYWLDYSFVPGPTDTRVNFYLGEDVMRVVERLGDVANSANSAHVHHEGMRHRRALVKSIECSALPGNSANVLHQPNIQYYVTLPVLATVALFPKLFSLGK
jgi:hypothetical protein